MNRISLARPSLEGNERAYVLDCVETSWISSIGKYITAFEAAFAEFCGVEHAIATNNGTTALHLAAVALGLKPGDEVIVPTLTYIATANAVTYCGGTPVLVDSEEHSLNLDPAKLEAAITSRTVGIIPVHLYGQPAAMGEIMRIARQHGLWVIEDAAEAHGASVGDRRVGTLGTCATFSFFGNKIVTTGEGGMVTTDDADLASRLRLLRGQGMDPERRYWFPIVGFNYRMTNIQAALGLAQMESIAEALAARDALGAAYDAAFAELDDRLEILPPVAGTRRVYWMYNVFLRNGDGLRRDRVMADLDEAGIETRPVFYPMHQLPPYRSSASFPVADRRAATGITLPMHQLLTDSDIERVAAALSTALGRR